MVLPLHSYYAWEELYSHWRQLRSGRPTSGRDGRPGRVPVITLFSSCIHYHATTVSTTPSTCKDTSCISAFLSWHCSNCSCLPHYPTLHCPPPATCPAYAHTPPPFSAASPLGTTPSHATCPHRKHSGQGFRQWVDWTGGRSAGWRSHWFLVVWWNEPHRTCTAPGTCLPTLLLAWCALPGIPPPFNQPGFSFHQPHRTGRAAV